MHIHLPIETVRKRIGSIHVGFPSWGKPLSSQLIQSSLEIGVCLFVKARNMFKTFTVCTYIIICTVYVYLNIHTHIVWIDKCILCRYMFYTLYIYIYTAIDMILYDYTILYKLYPYIIFHYLYNCVILTLMGVPHVLLRNRLF